jgi:beta-glucosidase
MHKIQTFPRDFLLGAASAAHQVEGDNIHSDWWILEHHPALAGKIVPSGKAVDHFTRYPDDIALLAGLGYNSYRFSIEWARIEPEEGKFSQDAIDHYQRMIDCVISHDMVPVVTLHHFTHPAWVAIKGEKILQDLPELFARYCAKVIRVLGDRISWLCTINEANIKDVMHLVLPGMDALFGGNRQQFLPFALIDSFETVTAAHKEAVLAIKAERSSLPVGWTLAASPVLPLNDSAAEHADALTNKLVERYLEVSKSDDFLGIQVYQRHIIDENGSLVLPGSEEETDGQGKRFDPESLELVLRRAWNGAKIPLMVTENGICTNDDTQRIRYIDRALAGVQRCIADGIDIKGYLHWTAFDNYEWGSYEHKFGLIAVDRETFVRSPKPSAEHLGRYGAMIQ